MKNELLMDNKLKNWITKIALLRDFYLFQKYFIYLKEQSYENYQKGEK